MRIKWRSLRVLVLACGLVLFCLVLLFIIRVNRDRTCSEKESHSLLEDLCQRFRQNTVDGNLCHDLCDTKTLQFVKCVNYRHGKKVLVMDCGSGVCDPEDGVKVVMKTKVIPKGEYDHLGLPLHANGTVTKEGMHIAKTVIENKAFGEMHYSVSSDKNIFTALWSLDYDKYVKNAKYTNADNIALLNIWSLIQQDEYLFMKIYQHLPYIPTMYGTCGEYYIVEFAPPGEVLDPGFMQGVSWTKRVDAALKLLDISQSLGVDFHEPLHFCDVKSENFGVGMDLLVKVIDSDSLFFNERMSMNLRDPCSRHFECDFFDCRGWCDVENKICNGRRSNNNVQNICEKILMDRPVNFFHGLLHEPPAAIARELSEVLEACAFPNKNKGQIVRVPTPRETYEKLHRLLEKTFV